MSSFQLINKIIKKEIIEFTDHQNIFIETGSLAKQADGAAVVKMGDTVILATVVAKKEINPEADFLPLFVDYQEKFSAAGKIPGGFFKREGRLNEHEIITSRLIDRVIRPLIPKDFLAETQISVYLLSADEKIASDCLVGLAASTALSVSDIPFQEPVSEVRVVRIGSEYIVNPSNVLLEKADMNLIVGATYENVIMVEGAMQQVSEKEMLEAIQYAHKAIKIQCAAQEKLASSVKVKKRSYEKPLEDEVLKKELKNNFISQIKNIFKEDYLDKKKRSEQLDLIPKEYLEKLSEEEKKKQTFLVNKYFEEIKKEVFRSILFEDKVRIDGRKPEEIRKITVEVDYLPSAHGSALFTRGETQSLTTVTLGGKLDEQVIDNVTETGATKFMLHYNFPAFSTGEVKPLRAPGRREIGHGNLAMRAVKEILPEDNSNPYTIRIVSDILESNGSSSMATVCGSTLALMDAGLPIKAPISGIAMGLVVDEAKKDYTILSDIMGEEDAMGDMDFKVAGTEKGITACQMDIKISGISYEILKKALEQAKQGRKHILEKMCAVIDKPRSDYKEFVPQILSIPIEKDLVGLIIGPAGKTIQKIQTDTQSTLVVEEIDNEHRVNIFAPNKQFLNQAEETIKNLTKKPVIGDLYQGIVKKIVDFGAFVEFLPGKEGLLHISEIKKERVENVKDVLQMNQKIQVKLISIDPKTNKYKLSHKKILLDKKVLLEKEKK